MDFRIQGDTSDLIYTASEDVWLGTDVITIMVMILIKCRQVLPFLLLGQHGIRLFWLVVFVVVVVVVGWYIFISR